jgi:pyruvate/2-oxoglutarate/acetoin dehydrogenase E1 component
MKYKEALKLSMEKLADDPLVRFVGYNTLFGRANGTLVNVTDDQCVETTVAENLMAGMAIGLSITGYKPIVYIERCDFIFNALDAIVNHLDKIEQMSKGEFAPKVVIRIVIGSKKNPLFTGITHTQDYTEVLQRLVSFPVIKVTTPQEVIDTYDKVNEWKSSYIVLEERDLYDIE